MNNCTVLSHLWTEKLTKIYVIDTISNVVTKKNDLHSVAMGEFPNLAGVATFANV